MKRVLRIFLTLVATVVSAYAQFAVNFTVVVSDSLKPISPYIYGTNQLLSGSENWTAIRLGGNRLTGYNWENNASNAGSDWNQSSDDYLASVFGISSDSSSIPGIVTTTFHNQALQLGAYSLVTLQMAGYVAKDKNGTVLESETAPSPRWAEVKFEKGSPLSLQPNTADDTVFMNEYVNFLVNNYSVFNSTMGINGYELDNEPDLWSSTHPRIHPSPTTCQEIIQKSIGLSEAVKNIDPSAEIFGPASYGFNGYLSFQNAPDWNSVSNGKGYSWFIDYYLDKMKAAEDSAGKRLLDVLDLHWYSEAYGSDNKRITDPGATTSSDDSARVQAPRTLWDSHYRENSWIAQYFSMNLPLIPKLMQSIHKYYPATKLAFTEINYGGENDISGAIAMADVLGIFAKYGVYLATFWELNSPSSYISAAYKIYRNYDSKNSKFGELYIHSQTGDSVNSSIYGSRGEGKNEIHLIVINKNVNQNITGNFSILSPKKIMSGKVWELNRFSSQIHELDSITDISNNSFSYIIQALTICHIVLQTSEASEVAEKNARVIPDKFSLSAFPNPFNPITTIRFSIPQSSDVSLMVYDILGRKVATILHQRRIPGSYEIKFDGSALASSLYFCRLESGIFTQTIKLLLQK